MTLFNNIKDKQYSEDKQNIENEFLKDSLYELFEDRIIGIIKKDCYDITDSDEKLFVWDLEKQLLIPQNINIGSDNRILSISFNGKFLAIGNSKGKINIYNLSLTSISEKISLDAHGTPNESPVNALAFKRDSKMLASGGDDCKIKLWNMTTMHKKNGENILGEHDNPISAIAFTHKGDLLASGDEEGIIKIWNIKTRKECYLEGHNEKIIKLSFSRDSQFLLSISEDKKMIIWENRDFKSF